MSYKTIEELSLNHWQALSTLVYDGWLLRFADGYTKRANSIQPLYGSTHEVSRKIANCEQIYDLNGLPATYKITPFVQPAHLDDLLAENGYALIDRTSVRTLYLDNLKTPAGIATVRIEENVTTAWIDHFCRLNGVKADRKPVLERMLNNIKTAKAFIVLYDGDEAVSCGFGVIEREYVGLYDVVTDVHRRNRGFGEQMLLHLLRWAKRNGAKIGYLAVVADNGPASRLYDKLGFAEIYTYWYRVKPD